MIAAGFDGGEPLQRSEPVVAQRQAPALPVATADEAAEVKPPVRESVSVGSASGPIVPEAAGFDSAFGDDDLDIPDFLK